jgi:hypothetical protein
MQAEYATADAEVGDVTEPGLRVDGVPLVQAASRNSVAMAALAQ